MAAIATTNVSAKLLREEANKLHGFAKTAEGEASVLRNKAADQDRQAAEMTKRATEYEASANTLAGA